MFEGGDEDCPFDSFGADDHPQREVGDDGTTAATTETVLPPPPPQPTFFAAPPPHSNGQQQLAEGQPQDDHSALEAAAVADVEVVASPPQPPQAVTDAQEASFQLGSTATDLDVPPPPAAVADAPPVVVEEAPLDAAVPLQQHPNDIATAAETTETPTVPKAAAPLGDAEAAPAAAAVTTATSSTTVVPSLPAASQPPPSASTSSVVAPAPAPAPPSSTPSPAQPSTSTAVEQLPHHTSSSNNSTNGATATLRNTKSYGSLAVNPFEAVATDDGDDGADFFGAVATGGDGEFTIDDEGASSTLGDAPAAAAAPLKQQQQQSKQPSSLLQVPPVATTSSTSRQSSPAPFGGGASFSKVVTTPKVLAHNPFADSSNGDEEEDPFNSFLGGGGDAAPEQPPQQQQQQQQHSVYPHQPQPFAPQAPPAFVAAAPASAQHYSNHQQPYFHTQSAHPQYPLHNQTSATTVTAPQQPLLPQHPHHHQYAPMMTTMMPQGPSGNVAASHHNTGAPHSLPHHHHHHAAAAPHPMGPPQIPMFQMPLSAPSSQPTTPSAGGHASNRTAAPSSSLPPHPQAQHGMPFTPPTAVAAALKGAPPQLQQQQQQHPLPLHPLAPTSTATSSRSSSAVSQHPPAHPSTGGSAPHHPSSATATPTAVQQQPHHTYPSFSSASHHTHNHPPMPPPQWQQRSDSAPMPPPSQLVEPSGPHHSTTTGLGPRAESQQFLPTQHAYPQPTTATTVSPPPHGGAAAREPYRPYGGGPAAPATPTTVPPLGPRSGSALSSFNGMEPSPHHHHHHHHQASNSNGSFGQHQYLHHAPQQSGNYHPQQQQQQQQLALDSKHHRALATLLANRRRGPSAVFTMNGQIVHIARHRGDSGSQVSSEYAHAITGAPKGDRLTQQSFYGALGQATLSQQENCAVTEAAVRMVREIEALPSTGTLLPTLKPDAVVQVLEAVGQNSDVHPLLRTILQRMITSKTISQWANGGQEEILSILRSAREANGVLPSPWSGVQEGWGQQEGVAMVEQLLLAGDRTEAVRCALHHKLYSHALILALVCDTKEAFQSVVRGFVEEQLDPHSALASAYCSFNELPPPSAVTSSSRNETTDPTTTLRRWLDHVTILVANFSRDAAESVLMWGDKLLEEGSPRNVEAAHVCFIIGQLSPAARPPQTDVSKIPPKVLQLAEAFRTRYTLVGGHYNRSCGRTALVRPSTVFFTEALEYSRQRENEKFVRPQLIPYRLMFSAMLMELGFTQRANSYLELLQRQLSAAGGGKGTSPLPAPKGGLVPSSLSDVVYLQRKHFHDHMQAMQSTVEGAKSSSGSTGGGWWPFGGGKQAATSQPQPSASRSASSVTLPTAPTPSQRVVGGPPHSGGLHPPQMVPNHAAAGSRSSSANPTMMPAPTQQPPPPQYNNHNAPPHLPSAPAAVANNNNKPLPPPAAASSSSSKGGPDEPQAKQPSLQGSGSSWSLTSLFRRGGSQPAAQDDKGGKGTAAPQPKKMILDDLEETPQFDPVTGRWLFQRSAEEEAIEAQIKAGPPKLPMPAVPTAGQQSSYPMMAPPQAQQQPPYGGGGLPPQQQQQYPPLPQQQQQPQPLMQPGQMMPPPPPRGPGIGGGAARQYVDMFN